MKKKTTTKNKKTKQKQSKTKKLAIYLLQIFCCPLQKLREYIKTISRNIKQKFTQQSLQNN